MTQVMDTRTPRCPASNYWAWVLSWYLEEFKESLEATPGTRHNSQSAGGNEAHGQYQADSLSMALAIRQIKSAGLAF